MRVEENEGVIHRILWILFTSTISIESKSFFSIQLGLISGVFGFFLSLSLSHSIYFSFRFYFHFSKIKIHPISIIIININISEKKTRIISVKTKTSQCSNWNNLFSVFFIFSHKYSLCFFVE